MLWQDRETAILDDGKAIHVPLGVIGLNMAGDTIFVGAADVLGSMPALSGVPAMPLTISEKLEISRWMLRSWGELVATLEDAIKPKPGKAGYQIDIE
jgi:hypothetical protein